MDGALSIGIAVRDGETRVVESYARAPFHYLPMARQDDGLPLLTIVNSSGGILGGDVLDMRIAVGPRAAVKVRQQAATKVYRSTRGAAYSRIHFVVADGTLLDYFPEEIIPFAGSAYLQTTHVELGRNALMLCGEIVTAGRLARGECFAFTRLTLDLQCTAGDTLLLRDRADLEPVRQLLVSPGILGDATIWGSFYVLATAPVDATLIQQIDEALRSTADGMGGATAIPAGIVGRVASTSLEGIRSGLQQARTLALERLHTGGDR